MNEVLIKQIQSIVDPDIPEISNLANISALIYQKKDINWAGFYFVSGDDLYLGPFQGDIACTHIIKGKGVCGTCLLNKETIIVPNVHEFKGHIACSSLSKSEIVVPVFRNDKVVMVIDVDSPIFDRFKKDDQETLEEVAKIISNL